MGQALCNALFIPPPKKKSEEFNLFQLFFFSLFFKFLKRELFGPTIIGFLNFSFSDYPTLSLSLSLFLFVSCQQYFSRWKRERT